MWKSIFLQVKQSSTKLGSLIVLIGHFFLAAIFAIAGVWLLTWTSTQRDSNNRNAALIAAAVFLVVGAGLVGMGVIRRNATFMVVTTNKRVLIKVGLASRRRNAPKCSSPRSKASPWKSLL